MDNTLTSELPAPGVVGLHAVVSHHGRTHLDLFSGIGGFALAAAANGFKTIGFSEIDSYATKVLKRHWPAVPNFGDIRNVRNVRADLVTGGFPCQPFSLAGEQRGAEDDRHLWPEMCRVIAEARPTWVLGENVPGIIGMELDNVLSDLEGLGYACWPIVVPACACDARHRRDRVWVVAYSERAERWAHDDGRGRAEQGQDGERQTASRARGCGALLADANRAGREEQRRSVANGAEHKTTKCGSRWQAEPGVGRVVNGLPNRVDRLKGLGNAIVPQVASEILKNLVMAN